MSKKIYLILAILAAFLAVYAPICYFFLGPISAMLVGQCLTLLLVKFVFTPILDN